MLAFAVVVPFAQTRTAKTLDVYLTDVEGGNATLFAAPSGESLLIDTGNGGAAATRDADRIMAAVNDAGLTQIDHLMLVCPKNRMGTVDLFVVTHHGQPVSSSEALVHAIQSRVAIMNSGTRKGIFIANLVDEPQTTIPLAARSPPPSGPNAPPPPAHNGPAYWIKVSAQQDGSFSVANGRNGFMKTYKSR